MRLRSNRVTLRAMEPNDAAAMYLWENDTSLWSLSGLSRPLSRAAIDDFIAGASLDIFAAGQMRLMIDVYTSDGTDSVTVGCVDLFAVDALLRRAGVGILVYDNRYRGRGYAIEALRLIVDYAFKHLGLSMLYADIGVSNLASTRLFRSAGFECTATRREWIPNGGGAFDDACFMQIFNSV